MVLETDLTQLDLSRRCSSQKDRCTFWVVDQAPAVVDMCLRPRPRNRSSCSEPSRPCMTGPGARYCWLYHRLSLWDNKNTLNPISGSWGQICWHTLSTPWLCLPPEYVIYNVNYSTSMWVKFLLVQPADWFDSWRVGDFNQHQRLNMCTECRSYLNLHRSPRQSCSHTSLRHTRMVFIWLFICLPVWVLCSLTKYTVYLLFPQVPQESPAEDNQAGHRPGGRLHQVGSSVWLNIWLSLSK